MLMEEKNIQVKNYSTPVTYSSLDSIAPWTGEQPYKGEHERCEFMKFIIKVLKIL
jgi:hypothetical protein